MKKLVALIVAVAATLSLTTGCYYEKIDTIVEWGFAPDDHSPISGGLEILLPSAQTLFNAFDNAFFSEYQKSIGHSAIMKEQTSKNKAIKNAKNTAETAVKTLPDGFSCPVAGVFVIRMRYGDNEEETVWARSFTGI